ncbi:MAG: EpsG family protein [Fusobacteriaceae bacterium]
MYIILIIFLILASLREIYFKDFKIWKASYCFLFFILIFRYGQGTDYFNYERHWKELNIDFLQALFQADSHLDFLVKNSMSLFKYFHISYEFYIIIYSIFLMLLLYEILKKVEYKAYFLLLFYPIIYLQYYFSSIRQAAAIMLGLLAVEKYYNKNLKKYLLFLILASMFHKSVLILLLIPILKKINLKTLFILLLLTISIYILRIDRFVYQLLPILSRHSEITKVNKLGMLNRMISLMFISFFMWNCKKTSKKVDEYFKLYLFGFVFYIVFMSNELLASRINIYFKIFEIYIYCNLIKIKTSYKNAIYILSLILTIILFTKEINSYLYQVEYINKNLLKYPYVNIFDKEKIYRYRNRSNINKARGIEKGEL